MTNAAINPRGPPAEVIKAWRAGRFSWVTSPPLLDELGRVLTSRRLGRYLTWSSQEMREFVAMAAEAARVVEPSRAISVVAQDPADNRVLEAAPEARADYIVSGDFHLLSLGEFEGIPILSPVRFLAALEEFEPQVT